MHNGIFVHILRLLFVDLSKLITFCIFTFGAPMLVGIFFNVNPDPIGASWGDVLGALAMVLALMATGYVMSVLLYKNRK